ncbi:MAG: diaminopimelate epimerase [Defluviitaleaceae bacterium]|nr:diaminopimelate epimerase [Defluviitaleaceae bacterium]
MSKSLHFTKMHSCGNDYIYFNCFDQQIDKPEALSVKLSHRLTGIGGDGIVMILPSDVADAKMRMFNSLDGSESDMAGNAIRCVAKYLYDNGLVRNHNIQIETGSGIKDLSLTTADGKVSAARVDMGTAILRPELIPVDLTGESVIARPVTIGSTAYKITCVSMGNPHAVVFISGMGELGSVELNAIDLDKVGPMFENNPIFPERVNVAFAQIIARNHLNTRVWERGSGETKGSGTGACATAVAAVLNGYGDMNTNIKIEMPGGELIVEYTDDTVYMTGDCVQVFEGIVSV